jgi:GDP-L-fucose synthase
MIQLHEKKILVTGGTGFLGKYVVEKLESFGCGKSFVKVPNSKSCDLRNQRCILNVMSEFHPDIVIHLAAVVGGIGANRANPGKFFYDNAIMGIQMMEYARQFGVEKFVTLGTVCSYPKYTPLPFKEEDIWSGYPEETNAPYGLAKKMLLVQAQAYREQYGFNSIYLIPVNLYGPRDNFDPLTSHVIPSMIRKFVYAKEANLPQVVLWGDGSPTREFLYVEDAAEAIVLATKHYNDPEPVNIGAGYEVSMASLAYYISGMVQYDGDIIWDKSHPNGQPRRMLDTTRAEQFGFKSKIGLNEGLKRTIDWYRKDKDWYDI